jgi:hypothetical protein
MAYLGFTLFLAGGASILVSDNWPPKSLGQDGRWPATLLLCALAVVVVLYLRFELRRRRWAELRVAGCEHVLVRLATGQRGNHAPGSRDRRKPCSFGRQWLDLFYPLQSTVTAIQYIRN